MLSWNTHLRGAGPGPALSPAGGDGPVLHTGAPFTLVVINPFRFRGPSRGRGGGRARDAVTAGSEGCIIPGRRTEEREHRCRPRFALRLPLLQERIDVIAREYGVRRIGLFGSFARGDAGPGSDVDVLVEFADPFVTFDRYMDLKFYLEDLFGRRVDLVIRRTLKPRIRETVEEEAVYVEVPAPLL